ncbi:MAG: glutamine amidotransferase [Aestuariibacter sp.]|nr:glutamine amidotransferase [Aestuariibacter sp.]
MSDQTIKPFLILQLRPEDDTSDGEFHAILKYGGLVEQDVRRMRIENTGIPDLNLNDYSAVIVGGSPFDISTPMHEKSSIQIKIEHDFNTLLGEVVTRDFPFLGACSGNGLLGSYLKTPISGKYAEAVGSAIVSLTNAGKSDVLLAGFPDQICVLLGHKEACDSIPVGATLLITGADCPVQMFRVGSNVYATQFHPEGDSEGFVVRIQAYKHHGYFKPAQAQQIIDDVSEARTPYAQKLLKRFVERYAR